MFKLIWCEDVNHGIGINNHLPWHIKAEMQHFKAETNNAVVLMGRKTFESIGKPLANRTNVVISRDLNFSYPDVTVYHDLTSAIKALKKSVVYVIGGKSIYEQCFNDASELIITTLKQNYQCDCFLKFDLIDFKLVKSINHELFTINYYAKKDK